MTHRLFYSIVDGRIVGRASHGGTIDGQTGRALIETTFPNQSAFTDTLDILEDFDPGTFDQRETVIDQTKIAAYKTAQSAARDADQAILDFVLEQNVRVFNSASGSIDTFSRGLTINELRGKDDPDIASTMANLREQYNALLADQATKADTFTSTTLAVYIPIPLAIRRTRDEESGHLVGNVWHDPSSLVPDAYGDTVTRDPALPSPEEERAG